MSITFYRTWEVEGVPTDPDAIPTLSNSAATIGIKRNDTGVSVVAAGTALTKVSTGVYSYTFDEPAVGLTYTAYIRIVYLSAVYIFEVTITGTPATAANTVITDDDIYADLGITIPTAAEAAVVTAAIKRALGAVKQYLGYDPCYSARTEYYPRMSGTPLLTEGVWEVNDTSAYLKDVSTGKRNELQLQHLPVRSITSLYIDYDGRSGTKVDSFSTDSLKTEGVDFWPNYQGIDSSGNKVCFDGILHTDGIWPSEQGCVKVTYTAGYTNDELQGNDNSIDASPIWSAVLLEATRIARTILILQKGTMGHVAGPKMSEKLGDYSYTLDTGMSSKILGGVTGSSGGLSMDTKDLLEPFVNYGSRIGG
jgi:hypothetical protein